MRIAGTSYEQGFVNQINQLVAQQYQLQNEASTNQSISEPSDNPDGMAEALNLQAENSDVTQYAQNITTLQSQATSASNVISSLNTIVNQASEIATEVGGTTSTTQMQAYAAQVTQLIQQAAQLVNTKDGNQYLFGGTANSQAPFTVTTDANGNVTGVTYQGNTSVDQNEIAANTTVTVDTPGENNTGSGPRGLVSDSRYGADLFGHLISLQNDLLSGNTSATSTTDAPNLNKDQENLSYQVGENGAVQSRLQAAAAFASNQQTGLSSSLNNVAGANLAQTLTQLSQVQNAYAAALQTSSQFMQMQQYVLS
jgi:flagellar hook-associated protein 3 FlgL